MKQKRTGGSDCDYGDACLWRKCETRIIMEDYPFALMLLPLTGPRLGAKKKGERVRDEREGRSIGIGGGP